MTFPDIDPIIVQIGPLALRWYGLMYVLAFTATYLLVARHIRRWDPPGLAAHFDNINMTLIISLVIGGRLGYVFFYNLSYYAAHPLQAFNTLAGGMSFHGGMLGAIVGGFWYCRRHKLNFLALADIYVATMPIGLGLGRIGNFINGELYGRVSEVPWAMVFPGGGPLPRHPSQLYEALLEGAVFFGLLAWASSAKRREGWGHGTILALFIFFYGALRFIVEFYREPDAHLGLLAGLLSRGQVLSLLMIVVGAALFVWFRRRPAGADGEMEHTRGRS
ncbi:MAG: prolipoprotein diacylglyceryl transferase [Thermodesulfobacteriota bacterium]